MVRDALAEDQSNFFFSYQAQKESLLIMGCTEEEATEIIEEAIKVNDAEIKDAWKRMGMTKKLKDDVKRARNEAAVAFEKMTGINPLED